jgi:hypothetical protein
MAKNVFFDMALKKASARIQAGFETSDHKLERH